ncbi:MAG: hypothetical protein AMK69_13655 [Nitrospira bacterium SG8_3]|nr:MAG: hypothetical protein AMK69_13655 [Nitrospira bacterium SG8_3]
MAEARTKPERFFAGVFLYQHIKNSFVKGLFSDLTQNLEKCQRHVKFLSIRRRGMTSGSIKILK